MTSRSPTKGKTAFAAAKGSYSPESGWLCNCPLPANYLQVGKEGANKRRFFYTCQKGREEQCGFFLWAEPDARVREQQQSPLVVKRGQGISTAREVLEAGATSPVKLRGDGPARGTAPALTVDDEEDTLPWGPSDTEDVDVPRRNPLQMPKPGTGSKVVAGLQTPRKERKTLSSLSPSKRKALERLSVSDTNTTDEDSDLDMPKVKNEGLAGAAAATTPSRRIADHNGGARTPPESKHHRTPMTSRFQALPPPPATPPLFLSATQKSHTDELTQLLSQLRTRVPDLASSLTAAVERQRRLAEGAVRGRDAARKALGEEREKREGAEKRVMDLEARNATMEGMIRGYKDEIGVLRTRMGPNTRRV
ncbi:hypothetical protein SAICODRAFT_23391 [Saitoella complicata NRRL Y-17804]|nr:uncharacterized protein SAICODRAFT_23391 [Saitoella complicata NRRL Y-17804]ODQ55346.1 hypothetical protein SAICODRAFT_23391 [Saitoella complicata NRRL Y-17804]